MIPVPRTFLAIVQELELGQKRIEEESSLQFTSFHFRDRQQESGSTVPNFDESLSYLLFAHDEHAAVVEPLLAAGLVVRPLAVPARAREEVPRAVGRVLGHPTGERSEGGGEAERRALRCLL